ncbi:MAG: type I methionyl aminopeptidase [Elusimicrobiales bacterium]|nr:type I methionyl aminopeptidase [Elusimicrobiales bacterium]
MIEIKTEKEIALIEKASRIVAETLLLVKENAKAGVSTLYLDRIAYENIIKNKAKPAFLGYRGFPATCCISVNEEVIHGIPSDKKILKEGDLVSVDIGSVYDGYYGDAAISFIIGSAKSPEHEKLLEVCEKSLYKGLNEIKDGAKLGDVSYAIGDFVFKNNMDVLREFTGHGIGRRLHEEPSIFNYGVKNTGPVLREGMTLAVEPMIVLGKADVDFKEDKWTVVTRDGSYSAHFEHTVVVTKKGYKILSRV